MRVPTALTGFQSIAWIVAATLTGCSCQQEAREANAQFPDSLVGSWVRVYPAPAGRDTILIMPDGVASGSHAVLSEVPRSAEHGRIIQWIIDLRFGPHDICFGDGGDSWCSNYELRGDTLALADGHNTVLLRAGSLRVKALQGDSASRGDRTQWGEVPPATPLGRGN
jgi:hypothetical protein